MSYREFFNEEIKNFDLALLTIVCRPPRVRFSVPKVTVDSTHQGPKIFCQSVHEVHDLCSVLGKPCSNSSCLGSFVHEKRRYHVHEEENKCTRRLKRLKQIFFRQYRKGLRPNER